MTGIVFKKSETEKIVLDDFLKALNEALFKMDSTSYPSLTVDGPYRTITAKPGRKYIKLVSESSGSKSVFCFLDFDGNIYKAASWSAPAKHVRGSLFDDNYSIGKGLGMYGAAYIKR